MSATPIAKLISRARYVLFCSGVFLAAVVLHAQQQLAPGATERQSAEQAAAVALSVNPAYRIGPGDVLKLKFSYNPEMDDTVTVRSDGGVTLRMAGEVVAQDKTPAELSAEVTELYGQYLKHPTVAVAVNKSANLQVYVGGEVVTPRMVPMNGRVTALQAVLSAGGPRSSANLKNVVWVRKEGLNNAVVRKINLKAIMRGEAPDLLLQPYDVLYLFRSKIGGANLFVEQFINGLLPRNLIFFGFNYNLNTVFRVE